MFSQFGISGRIKAVGVARCRCPACGGAADLHVFRRWIAPRVAYTVNTVPLRIVYTAVCPRCAAVYRLNPAAGRGLERRSGQAVSRRDLRPERRLESRRKRDSRL